MIFLSLLTLYNKIVKWGYAMSTIQIVTIGAVTFLVLAEGSALFMYVWDSTHNIPVPMGIVQFITMGLTYAISSLSHQQGSKTALNGQETALEIQSKTGVLSK